MAANPPATGSATNGRTQGRRRNGGQTSHGGTTSHERKDQPRAGRPAMGQMIDDGPAIHDDGPAIHDDGRAIHDGPGDPRRPGRSTASGSSTGAGRSTATRRSTAARPSTAAGHHLRTSAPLARTGPMRLGRFEYERPRLRRVKRHIGEHLERNSVQIRLPLPFQGEAAPQMLSAHHIL
jgi:hypothetical protein